jgi:hypothetical protein
MSWQENATRLIIIGRRPAKPPFDGSPFLVSSVNVGEKLINPASTPHSKVFLVPSMINVGYARVVEET